MKACLPKGCIILVQICRGNVTARDACVMYSAWNFKDNYDMNASVFVIQFNGFMSLTSDFDVTYSY